MHAFSHLGTCAWLIRISGPLLIKGAQWNGFQHVFVQKRIGTIHGLCFLCLEVCSSSVEDLKMCGKSQSHWPKSLRQASASGCFCAPADGDRLGGLGLDLAAVGCSDTACSPSSRERAWVGILIVQFGKTSSNPILTHQHISVWGPCRSRTKKALFDRNVLVGASQKTNHHTLSGSFPSR